MPTAIPIQNNTFNFANSRLIICSILVNIPNLLSLISVGHFFEDMMNWWLASKILEIPTKRLVLLNIDGLRPGNIMQGKGRFHTVPLPDHIGAFELFLRVLFDDVISLPSPKYKSVVAHRGRNVSFKCLRQVHALPFPLIAFLWRKFEIVDSCSLQDMVSLRLLYKLCSFPL